MSYMPFPSDKRLLAALGLRNSHAYKEDSSPQRRNSNHGVNTVKQNAGRVSEDAAGHLEVFETSDRQEKGTGTAPLYVLTFFASVYRVYETGPRYRRVPAA